MNHIVLHGRMVRDPEGRSVGERTVVNFTVAVNRAFKRDEADFFECAAWGKTGEFVQKYFGKGQEILLSGEMQMRKYQAQDGTSRVAWSVNVANAEFCGPAKDHQNTQQSAPVFESAQEVSDDDMPF